MAASVAAFRPPRLVCSNKLAARVTSGELESCLGALFRAFVVVGTLDGCDVGPPEKECDCCVGRLELADGPGGLSCWTGCCR